MKVLSFIEIGLYEVNRYEYPDDEYHTYLSIYSEI